MTLRHVIQGEFAIGSTPDTVISSTLGSCVSICLWDPKARVGGMNHMLLPDSSNIQVAHQFGSVDMERLVNALMRDLAKKE
ncbi:MAG: chemotaxis protein CheD, partial [Boseongicola sp.]|nr:chemotaxis protein CheD [Boseongicola sp.]